MTPPLRRGLQLLARRPVEAALAIAIVLAINGWIYVGVRISLAELARAQLRTLVDTQVTVLETWIAEKRLNVQRWSADPRIEAIAGQLAGAAASSPAAARAACLSPARGALLETVDTLRRGEPVAAVNLVDPAGRVIASRFDAYCGVSVAPDTMAKLAPVLAGESVFAGPVSEAERLGKDVAQEIEEPTVWFSAPVRDASGRIVAALNVGKSAGDRFSRILTAARTGASGEAYAFDGRGRMLSESRFAAALVAEGRLPAGSSAILNLDLSPPAENGAAVPLTRLIAAALAARGADSPALSGEVVTPYPNYLGTEVVGAWRWLPAYSLGVVVEIGATEAFAPLTRLEYAFFAVLGMAGILGAVLVVAAWRIERLQREHAAGNYDLIEQIGEGGIARVYRARHRLLKRPTAVKIVKLAMATDEMLARFDREVRLASQLSHPNTVEIYDYGRTDKGEPYYAMELLDGLDLQALVDRDGPLPPARVAHILRGVAGSLAEAHERGLLHRDIKPANVMVCRRGGEFDVVKVLDFGLVKDIRGPQSRDLTRSLQVLGTPAFMAPERIRDPGGAEARSDLYALGALGFFLLAGRPPFAGDSDLSIAYHVVHTPAPRPPASGSAPALADLIMRCLEKDPARRPAAADEIVTLLDGLLAEMPWTHEQAREWWSREQPPPAASG